MTDTMCSFNCMQALITSNIKYVTVDRVCTQMYLQRNPILFNAVKFVIQNFTE